MNVKASMKKRVISVQDTDDLGTAAKKFVKHHVGMLPVISAEGKLVGVLQLRDLLNLALPDFTRLMEDFDFVGTFGAANSIQPSKEQIAKKVSDVMEPPVFVEDTCGLTRAFALLHKHNLTDLPVVDAENRLLGIASRVDIGTSILKSWEIIPSD
ncbi:MAG: CBS domain-containing protein [Anaerolineales bacterium]